MARCIASVAGLPEGATKDRSSVCVAPTVGILASVTLVVTPSPDKAEAVSDKMPPTNCARIGRAEVRRESTTLPSQK